MAVCSKRTRCGGYGLASKEHCVLYLLMRAQLGKSADLAKQYLLVCCAASPQQRYQPVSCTCVLHAGTGRLLCSAAIRWRSVALAASSACHWTCGSSQLPSPLAAHCCAPPCPAAWGHSSTERPMHALRASATADLAVTHSCLSSLWCLVLCPHQIELDVIECFTLCEVVVIWDCQQPRLVATHNRLCRTQHMKTSDQSSLWWLDPRLLSTAALQCCAQILPGSACRTCCAAGRLALPSALPEAEAAQPI